MEAVVAQTDVAWKITSRKRVLVVDDDPLLLKALSDILENDGHQVVTANGGQAGIDSCIDRNWTGVGWKLQCSPNWRTTDSRTLR